MLIKLKAFLVNRLIGAYVVTISQSDRSSQSDQTNQGLIYPPFVYFFGAHGHW